MDSLILVAFAVILMLLCEYVSGQAGAIFAGVSVALMFARAVHKVAREEP